MTRRKTIDSQKQRTKFKNQSLKSKINIQKKKDLKIKEIINNEQKFTQDSDDMHFSGTLNDNLQGYFS